MRSSSFFCFGIPDLNNLHFKFNKEKIIFGRKFDPLLNQAAINYLDQSSNGEYESADYLATMNSYWLNVYESKIEDYDSMSWRFKFLIELLINQKLNLKKKEFDLLNIHQYFHNDEYKGELNNKNKF